MAAQLEEPKYTVARSFDAFELRRYDANIQARVQTGGDGAASGGFRRVARYIFGGNQTGEFIDNAVRIEVSGRWLRKQHIGLLK